MTLVSCSGPIGGAVAMGGPVGIAMGSLLMGLLAATTFALVLGAERAQRQDPAIELQPPADDRAAAA
jgi:hypothetical protein